MMYLELSMKRDENKFTSQSWWATSPEFVLYTLRSQLLAASVIWPELEAFEICATKTAPAEKDAAGDGGGKPDGE